MKWIAIAILSATLTAAAQDFKKADAYVQMPPRSVGTVGTWVDVTKDNASGIWMTASGPKLLFIEDYEVIQTHEVCASVEGLFLESANRGHYNVTFKGMRTSATFTFTTQYAAEQWAQKFCTPESLTTIKPGRGTLARNY